MKVIGLTGGTGSGKGEVSKCLRQAGAFIIDADEIAHQIIKKGQPAYFELTEYFGREILQENGEIFRRRLGEIVFQDKQKLKFLNQCTHKHIVRVIVTQIAEAKAQNTAKCVIIDAPLLIEARLVDLCDSVWVVYAAEEERARRIMQRDGITYEQAKARIQNQKTWAEYESYAQAVIDNSTSIEDVERQIQALLKNI